jgi:V8-like Glu-specific endopeptidase
MKKLLLAAFCAVSLSANAQETPIGYAMSEAEIDQLHVVELENLNPAELIREAEEDDKMGKMSMYGRIIDLNVTPENYGVWKALPNGDMIWQLRFRVPSAQAVSVIFNDLYLPEGSKMYLYSADRSYFEGPYDFKENNASGIYRTAEVFGDEAVLEYYQPASVIGNAHLGIRGFVHFFRFIYDSREDRGGVGTSEACEIDVNCPEGTEWVDQRQSVVRLSLVAGNGVGLCTGSLVNNTSGDCANYILTAMHCTIDSDASDLLASTVRFNFQRANCGSGSASQTQQKVGLILKADSNDNGGASGSDFALVEMEDAIPSSWNPFYAGWNAGTTAPTADSENHKGFCIHHPAGDAKKFSTAGTVTTGTYSAANHHWRVNWVETETDWGVTEGGSSGSPLYNKEKQIIGTLTGGGSFCDAPTASDYYGKMDKHWTGNPNPANEDLVDWLDAAGTGWTTMNGAYVGSGATPCMPVASTEELTFEDVKVFPSFASDVVNISGNAELLDATVKIFDASGKLVSTFVMLNETATIDVTAWENGVYFISFQAGDHGYVTQKITIVH